MCTAEGGYLVTRPFARTPGVLHRTRVTRALHTSHMATGKKGTRKRTKRGASVPTADADTATVTEGTLDVKTADIDVLEVQEAHPGSDQADDEAEAEDEVRNSDPESKVEAKSKATPSPKKRAKKGSKQSKRHTRSTTTAVSAMDETADVQAPKEEEEDGAETDVSTITALPAALSMSMPMSSERIDDELTRHGPPSPVNATDADLDKEEAGGGKAEEDATESPPSAVIEDTVVLSTTGGSSANTDATTTTTAINPTFKLTRVSPPMGMAARLARLRKRLATTPVSQSSPTSTTTVSDFTKPISRVGGPQSNPPTPSGISSSTATSASTLIPVRFDVGSSSLMRIIVIPGGPQNVVRVNRAKAALEAMRRAPLSMGAFMRFTDAIKAAVDVGGNGNDDGAPACEVISMEKEHTLKVGDSNPIRVPRVSMLSMPSSTRA